jgi:hypothetical protein
VRQPSQSRPSASSIAKRGHDKIKLCAAILLIPACVILPLRAIGQRPPQNYPGAAAPIPSGIPKMAQDHLANARKSYPDAYLVAVRVHNYFMIPGQIPQHGVYGVYLTYFSPKSGKYVDYAVGPNREDVLLQGMPPGSVPKPEIGMLPLHFVDLPQALAALEAHGASSRIQSAIFRFIAGDQPNIYAVWDIHTLGGHTRPLYVLGDSGKVVDLADLHPNAVRGDPDIWLENLLAENLRKLNEQQQQAASPESNSSFYSHLGVPPCYATGSIYAACIGHNGVATTKNAEQTY